MELKNFKFNKNFVIIVLAIGFVAVSIFAICVSHRGGMARHGYQRNFRDGRYGGYGQMMRGGRGYPDGYTNEIPPANVTPDVPVNQTSAPKEATVPVKQ